MRCDFADSLLQGYFDGELSASGSAEFERHLQHCGPCAAELVDLDLLHDSLQLAQLYELGTPSLRRKIEARLRAIVPNPTASQPLFWHWLAAAAALVLVAVVLWRVSSGLRKDDYQAELAGELVENHVRSLPNGHINGVTSGDEHVVKGWFDGKLMFAIPVRDFANQGFALKGGRLVVIEGRSVAVLVYEGNGRPIDVFIWRTGEPDTSARTGSRQDFQWVDWRKVKIEFCAVSDAGREDLEKLHQLINSSS